MLVHVHNEVVESSSRDHGRAREVIRRIARRIDLEDFTEGVLDSFWSRPEYQRFQPSRDELRSWVQWNIDLVLRWLAEDRRPSPADLERFRERARAWAADGMPADMVPANFRRGARYAWTALLDAAHEDERPALLESADLLFEFVDQVSQLFSAAYESAEPANLISEDDRLAHELLERVCCDTELTGEEQRLAEDFGFDLGGPHLPFVIIAPRRSVRRHAALAARLRSHGALATFEGRRVVGLSPGEVSWRELAAGDDAAVAQGTDTAREELSEALDELRAAAQLAVLEGRSGVTTVDDHLASLLLRRSPRLGRRLDARVYGRLSGEPELRRTLDALMVHDFDRARTASALPVHRNTLTNRLNRIATITGLDVDGADGRGLLWLAWLGRR
jgi:PucR C-terminal helix-turn-helix domain